MALPTAVLLLVALVLAYAVAALTVPVIHRFAVRHDLFVDYPDGDRRKHARPVPRLGGIAVFVGSLLSLTVVAILAGQPYWSSVESWVLLLATAILFCIGLLDDLRGVSPAFKLVGQSVAALLVAFSGTRIDVVSLIPGSDFALGFLAVPVTVVWLVGVSNAFNLIDGLDGLAGGVGVIALFAISAAAVILGNPTLPVMCVGLMGALLGFLRYNRAPARIFLGDSGSLVVGFLLALFAVKGATRSDGVVYGLVPLFALSYLLLDTGIAMLRRWLRGAPLSRADGRHIHHQLQALLLSSRRAVYIIYAESAFVAALGLCITFVPPRMTLLIGGIGLTVLLFIMVYGVRWLDYHEFLEAGASLASGVRKGRLVIRDRIAARDVVPLLMRATSHEALNLLLADHARTFRFAHMRLELPGAPHAETRDWLSPFETWKLEFPIRDAVAPASPRARPPMLTIWGFADTSRPDAGAERVVQILAPALTEWLASVTIEPSAPAVAPPRPARLHVPGVHGRAEADPRGHRAAKPTPKDVSATPSVAP
jgi:UDP-GlcNAc:undecaprenyl-phosphate GlcNAc-1-phosphate transferase